MVSKTRPVLFVQLLMIIADLVFNTITPALYQHNTVLLMLYMLAIIDFYVFS